MPTAIQIPRFGGPEVLKAIDLRSPPPKAGQIRVGVRASGVNFADIMMRMGLYPEAPKPPFVPGYEIAGQVLEVGEGVTAFGAGDRVVAGCRFGGYAAEVTIDAASARKIPPRISEVEAAAIPVNFLTAGIALWTMARVGQGDRVLIPNAAGGVGVAAVQIAKLAGATVTGTAGSEAKLAMIRELGASEAFTYDEFEGREPAKFDVILDAAGGAAAKRNLKRLALGGRMVCFGVANMVAGRRRSIFRSLGTLAKTPILTPLGLMMANHGIFGLNLLKFFESESQLASATLDRILAGVQAGSLRTVIGKTFPLEHAGEAHEYLMSRANVGKVILTTGD